MGAGDDGEREESLMFGWWGGSRVGLDLGQLGIEYHAWWACSLSGTAWNITYTAPVLLLGGGGFQGLILDCLYQHGGSLPSALPPL